MAHSANKSHANAINTSLINMAHSTDKSVADKSPANKYEKEAKYVHTEGAKFASYYTLNNNSVNSAQIPEVADIIKSSALTSKSFAPIECVADIPGKLSYTQHADYLLRIGLHVGQLKLAMGEIQFMTKVLGNNGNIKTNTSGLSKGLFVYAGSAPSNPLMFILDLFKGSKYICVDSNEHGFLCTSEFGNYGVFHYYAPTSREVVYLAAAPGNRWNLKRDRIIYMFDIATKKIIPINRDREYDKATAIGAANIRAIESGDPAMAQFICKRFVEAQGLRILVIEDMFTNDIAKMLSSANTLDFPLYFLSDIRTNILEDKFIRWIREINANIPAAELDALLGANASGSSDETASPGDIDIIWNLAQQINWINIMRPHKSLLKFRHLFYSNDSTTTKKLAALKPFCDDLKLCPIDLVGNYTQGKFQYLRPTEIYLQAFAGPISTETRLLYEAPADRASPLEFIFMDTNEFEDRINYYNSTYRWARYHDWPANFMQHPQGANNGIDHCSDCALCLHIFCEYLAANNAVSKLHSSNEASIEVNFAKAHQLFTSLMQIINRKLFNMQFPHGHMHAPIDVAEYIRDFIYCRAIGSYLNLK